MSIILNKTKRPLRADYTYQDFEVGVCLLTKVKDVRVHARVCASHLSRFIFAMLLHGLKHTHCLQNFPFRPVPAKDRQRFYKLELECV